ncbi:hypothetical protein UFOVP1333_23 [uncultured Caudovirales phage]|uniref:Uncharacterized protein n=1 Tax=uncultured Caudovirales phage TaxID=2100421 RepID=A0A6J5RZL0_9CAUD|nr:hypothetical protein UFOVP1333_23 [uncultured Caudovirales phage]
MLFKTFGATGVSQSFYGMRGGFDLILSMTGTNSLTIEREVVKGTWVTWGSAITAAGVTHKTSDVDYCAPLNLRLNLGTKDSGSVLAYLEGAFLADEFTMIEGEYSLLTESEEDLVTENDEYILQEA